MSLVIGESTLETVDYWRDRALRAEARADQAEALCATWEKRARSEREMHEHSNERNRAMTSVVMNKTMDEVDRIAILVAGIITESEFQQAQAKGTADDFWRPNPMAVIADRAGMSDDTLRASQKRQAAAGLINRRKVTVREEPKAPGEKTKYRSQSVINREPDLNAHWFQAGAVDMKAALPPREFEHGGARTPNMDRHCPKCGSDNTKLKCCDCSHTVHTTKLPEVKALLHKEAREKVKKGGKPQDAETVEEGAKPQDAAVRDIVTSPTETTSPTLLVNTPREPQDAVSLFTPQSFDPDDLAPDEPPLDLLWDDGTDAWLNA